MLQEIRQVVKPKLCGAVRKAFEQADGQVVWCGIYFRTDDAMTVTEETIREGASNVDVNAVHGLLEIRGDEPRSPHSVRILLLHLQGLCNCARQVTRR